MSELRENISIAIDGPVGSGKSTIAKLLANRLGFLYIDTGAMYRAVTYKVLDDGVDPEDKESVADFTKSLEIELVPVDNGLQVFVNGEDVTAEIRTPEVSRYTSPVADNIGVREELVKQQQRMALTRSVVMEGRDISTVVLPDAPIKFYVDGDPEERAARRVKDLKEKGMEVDFESTLKDLLERDKRDSSRPVGALTRVPEAVYIDTTDLAVEKVVDKMYNIFLEKFPDYEEVASS